MSESTVSMVHRLVAAIPELVPMLAEHIDDMNGELLPHVFFGEVTRWAERSVFTETEAVRRLLVLLNDEYSPPDTEIRELIYVSFLEFLSPDVRGLLGPNLRAALAEVAP